MLIFILFRAIFGRSVRFGRSVGRFGSIRSVGSVRFGRSVGSDGSVGPNRSDGSVFGRSVTNPSHKP